MCKINHFQYIFNMLDYIHFEHIGQESGIWIFFAIFAG